MEPQLRSIPGVERYTRGTPIRLQIAFALIAWGAEETRNRVFLDTEPLQAFLDTADVWMIPFYCILPTRVARQNTNIARSGVMLV